MKAFLVSLVILCSHQIMAQNPAGVKIEKSQEIAYIVDSVPYYQDLWTVTKEGVEIGFIRHSETMDSDVKGKFDASTPDYIHPFDYFSTVELAANWLVKEYERNNPSKPVNSLIVGKSEGGYTEFLDNNLKLKIMVPSDWVIQSKQFMPEITGEKQPDGSVKLDLSKMRANAPDYNSINFMRSNGQEFMIGIQVDKEYSISDQDRINYIGQVITGSNTKINGSGTSTINGINFLWIEISDNWGKRKLYTTVSNGNRYYFSSGIGFSPELTTIIETEVLKVLGSVKFL